MATNPFKYVGQVGNSLDTAQATLSFTIPSAGQVSGDMWLLVLNRYQENGPADPVGPETWTFVTDVLLQSTSQTDLLTAAFCVASDGADSGESYTIPVWNYRGAAHLILVDKDKIDLSNITGLTWLEDTTKAYRTNDSDPVVDTTNLVPVSNFDGILSFALQADNGSSSSPLTIDSHTGGVTWFAEQTDASSCTSAGCVSVHVAHGVQGAAATVTDISRSGASGSPDWHLVNLALKGIAPPLTAEAYRFYDDEGAALGRAVNGPISVATGTAFRLVQLVQAAGDATVKLKLQARPYEGSATPGAWVDVTPTSNGVKAVAAGLTDDATTGQLIGSGTNVAGRQVTDGVQNTAVTLANNEETEIHFGVQFVDDSEFDDLSLVEFQVVDADSGVALSTYTVYPHASKRATTSNEAFEGGTPGQGTELDVNDVIFDAIVKWGTSPSFSYDSSPAQGDWSALYSAPADGNVRLELNVDGPTLGFRIEGYFASLPGVDWELFRLTGKGETSSGVVLQGRVNGSNQLYLRDKSLLTIATFTNPFPSSQWFRLGGLIVAESGAGQDDLSWSIGLDLDATGGYDEVESDTLGSGDWLFEKFNIYGEPGTDFNIDNVEFATYDPGQFTLSPGAGSYSGLDWQGAMQARYELDNGVATLLEGPAVVAAVLGVANVGEVLGVLQEAGATAGGIVAAVKELIPGETVPGEKNGALRLLAETYS